MTSQYFYRIDNDYPKNRCSHSSAKRVPPYEVSKLPWISSIDLPTVHLLNNTCAVNTCGLTT